MTELTLKYGRTRRMQWCKLNRLLCPPEIGQPNRRLSWTNPYSELVTGCVLCGRLTTPNTRLALLLHAKKGRVVPKTQIYGPIKNFDKHFTKKSNAVSFNLESLGYIQRAESLTITKLESLKSFRPWFTSSLMDTGGDDGIISVPNVRKKVLIAKHGNPSRQLESLLTTVKSMVDLLTKSPSNCFIASVKFFLTTPKPLMMQPAVCAHIALNPGERPILVVGSGGYMPQGSGPRTQVLNNFATGLEREKRRYL